MDTATIVMSVSNLLIATLVPFLSVYVAQRLARKDTRTHLTMQVLVKVRTDAHRFKHAFLARHPEAWANLPADEKAQRTVALLESAEELDGDCLQLGLLFDQQANKLGGRLHDVVDTAQILFGMPCGDGTIYPIPAFNVCQEKLDAQITELCHEMRPLWDAMVAEPVLRRFPKRLEGKTLRLEPEERPSQRDVPTSQRRSMSEPTSGPRAQ